MPKYEKQVEPPNYDAWFKKPGWTSAELICVAYGLDPSLADKLHSFEVDVSSGESRPIIDEGAASTILGAVVKNEEAAAIIDRSIKAGIIKPMVPGSDCFDPSDAIINLAPYIRFPEHLLAAAHRAKKGKEHANHGTEQDDGEASNHREAIRRNRLYQEIEMISGWATMTRPRIISTLRDIASIGKGTCVKSVSNDGAITWSDGNGVVQITQPAAFGKWLSRHPNRKTRNAQEQDGKDVART